MDEERIISLNLHSAKGRREFYEIVSQECNMLNAYRASLGEKDDLVKQILYRIMFVLGWARNQGMRIELEISPVTGQYELVADGWYQFDERRCERNANRT